MRTIGITTTVPIEVLMAAGCRVIDLNNIFVASPDYAQYIDIAESEGFPKSLCAWIKGLYGACVKNDIKEVIGVVEGDCSNTKALIEVLKSKGIRVIPFAFPHTHSLKDIKVSIDSLAAALETDIGRAEEIRQEINKVRQLSAEIDRYTWQENKATGFENHLYQIMLSDMNGDVSECEKLLQDKLHELKDRPVKEPGLRLGYIGVPPMTCDLFDYVENFNAGFVYNEVQREFAFPRAAEAKNIYEQYYDYTYPYDIHFRLNEIRKQIRDRKIDGIIHYTQAFCYRAVEDIIIKQELDIPVLNIEGDKLNVLDSRTKLRLEAFLDMLKDSKEGLI